jgi:hypothetical protein
MLRLDTTNHRLYVRDGGVWRYAQLNASLESMTYG